MVALTTVLPHKGEPSIPRLSSQGTASSVWPTSSPHDGHVLLSKQEFLGVWNVESVLSSVKLPLGPDFVPDARVRPLNQKPCHDVPHLVVLTLLTCIPSQQRILMYRCEQFCARMLCFPAHRC